MGCNQFELWNVLGCCLRVGFSYLVEVDVHALELEVGGAVVTVACQMDSLALLHQV